MKILNNFHRSLKYPFGQDKLYEDLAPALLNENTYTKALAWGLKNPKVHNIALTGSYGSGKSSVLVTLRHFHPEFNYLNISLATFEEKDDVPSDELNKRIELSILQQMLYLEKGKTLPDSRFKRIKNYRNYLVATHTFIWMIVCLSYLHLYKNESLIEISFYENALNNSSTKTTLDVMALIVIFFGLYIIIKNIVKSLAHFKFEKINSKLEVELNREVSENSILNKNLDEIIYFFERTKYNVVIIEDLDRFKEPEIYTKLREINLLLNNSKQIKRQISFIYALKDEIFKNGDRTKFFDFFVPIIPYINSSNSYDLLAEKFKDENIDDKLLDDISLYIDDMRLLKNIINEFKIYNTELKIPDSYKNKLLSFIIYKNKFPEDFAKLHFNEGMIYKVFNDDIYNLRKILYEHLKANNDKLITELNELNNAWEITIPNLRRLYISKIIEQLPNENVTIHLAEKYTPNDIEKLISDDTFEEILQLKNIPISYRIWNSSTYQWNTHELTVKSIKGIQSEIDPNINFIKHQELIVEKQQNGVEKLQAKISENEDKMEAVSKMGIAKLIEHNNVGLNEDILKEDILVYFLRNSLIDEDYYYYISLLHETEKSLSRNDKNYILAIRNKKPLEFTYRLNNLPRILSKIESDFNSEEILNIDLVNYILGCDKKQLIEKIGNLFTIETKRKIDFINSYIKQGLKINLFISVVAGKWDSFWDYIFERSTYTKIEKDSILLYFLILDESILTKQNKYNKLTSYISSLDNFLNLVTPEHIQKIKKSLLNLKVKFSVPFTTEDKHDFLNFILENELYDINAEMIRFILQSKTEISTHTINNLQTTNFTVIKDVKTKDDLLGKYIKKEINTYAINVLANMESIDDDEEIILELLNDSNINENNKVKILEKVTVDITALESIKQPDFWKNILINNKLILSWQNVIIYYEKYEFDNILIDFLNTPIVNDTLSNLVLPTDEKGKNKVKDFAQKLIKIEGISEETFANVIKSFPKVYNLDFDNLSEEKVALLIKSNILLLSVENYTKLKEEYENLDILLLEIKGDIFVNKAVDYITDSTDLLKVLQSSTFSNIQKTKVIHAINEDIYVDDDKILKEIGLQMISSATVVSEVILLKILKLPLLTSKQRIQIFILNSSKINRNSITEFISTLNDSYSKIAIPGKQPLLEFNDLNSAFANTLWQLNYISKVDVNTEKGIRIYTFRK